MGTKVSWSEASAVIRGEALARARPAVVAVSGPVGAGKSSLAARISACVVSTDSYLPDYDAVSEHARDLPESADLPLLREHLALLGRGLEAPVPVWSFRDHKRVGASRVLPGEIVVVEGLHALHESLHAFTHLKVFVEASPATRLRRWEKLEESGERGWGVEAARRYFADHAEPTFARSSASYRAWADLIVTNESSW